MRVLLFVPTSRNLPASRESILALRWDGGLDTYFCSDGDEADAHRFENITRKYQRGREMALAGGYDAMATVEDDILVPPDALIKLADTDAQVAHGLVCWRHPPYRWSVAVKHELNHHVTVDQAGRCAEFWGRQDRGVVGVGLYCTLIRRDALEAIEFRYEPDGNVCCDWYHALDVQSGGFSRCVDFGVVCGHILVQEGGERAVWPDRDDVYQIGQL